MQTSAVLRDFPKGLPGIAERQFGILAGFRPQREATFKTTTLARVVPERTVRRLGPIRPIGRMDWTPDTGVAWSGNHAGAEIAMPQPKRHRR